MFNINDVALIMALPGESQGLFENEKIPVLYCGIGKINAAFAAADIIHKTKCKVVINLGTAGSSKFKTHDLVECTSFVQRDMDVSPLGFKVGETPLDEFPAEISGTAVFPDLPKGICGTGDSFETGTPKVFCELIDMEAYALAKVCKKMNVLFISLKYITDGADHNAHNDWASNMAHGAAVLLRYFKQIVSAE